MRGCNDGGFTGPSATYDHWPKVRRGIAVTEPVRIPEISCVVDCRNGLGEGCIWDDGRKVLWWVEMIKPSLHQFDPTTGRHRVWPGTELMTSLAVRANGSLLVSCKSGLSVFNPRNGEFTHAANFPIEETENRPNDSGVDPRGRLWLGTVHDTMTSGRETISFNRSAGALYRIDPDFRMTRMETGVGIANAVQWSPDGKTLYFVDSVPAVIYAYDFDVDAGSISNRRTFSNLAGFGLPDGAAIDADGYLWSARWDASCVLRFAPNGELNLVIRVPAERVTCCTFGGDKLDTLYITTARFGLSERSLEQQPLQGGLFAVRTSVTGISRNTFMG